MTTSSSSAADPADITSNISLFKSEVRAVYERVRADFVLPSVPMTVGPLKSTDLAKTYRSEGLKFMFERCKENRKPAEAIEMITRSVALSLENSQELATAYADRSMVFFEVGQFESCLFDINRALTNENCPIPLKSILLDRKRKCLSQIEQSSADAGEVETIYTIKGDESDPIDNVFELPSVRWSDEFDNPRIIDASSKIEFKYDQTWGRHMVAAKNIDVGDILSCEQFFSFGVPPDGRYRFNHRTKETTLSKWEECNLGYYDHCSHCGKRCKGLIPCPSCTAFLFCSEECRRAAYDSYHRTECRMGALYWLGDRVCTLHYFLAVRTLLVGTEQGATLGELMKRLTIEEIFETKLDPIKEPFKNNYESLLKLSTTVDQSLIRSRMEHAVQVVIVLRSLGFFKDVSKNSTHGKRRRSQRMNYAEVFVTALLLNHFNTEKLYEYLEPKYVKEEGKEFIIPGDRIILGTLVLHALINHGCDPNADYFVSKRQHVLYAKRPIKKGQQIFISYYGQSYWVPIKGGHPLMLQLPFFCLCDACTNDWPTSAELYNKQILKIVAGTKESALLYVLKQLAAPLFKPLHLPEIRETVIKILKVLNEQIERPTYILVLFDQYMSLFTRLLYDEINNRDHQLLDCRDSFDMWLNVEASRSEEHKNRIIAHSIAVNRELISLASEYLRKTRI